MESSIVSMVTSVCEARANGGLSHFIILWRICM